ncbi:hypothetical protein ACTSKR_07525 [Chitinibacteraceae bacterium HSL-7]
MTDLFATELAHSEQQRASAKQWLELKEAIADYHCRRAGWLATGNGFKRHLMSISRCRIEELLTKLALG